MKCGCAWGRRCNIQVPCELAAMHFPLRGPESMLYLVAEPMSHAGLERILVGIPHQRSLSPQCLASHALSLLTSMQGWAEPQPQRWPTCSTAA